jgi:hypothetical protein
MSGNDPVFNLRYNKRSTTSESRQCCCRPAGSANHVLAKADALEVTMKAFSWVASTGLQPPQCDPD